MHDGTRKPAILGRSEKSEDLPDGRSETRGCLIPVEGPGKRVTEGENDKKNWRLEKTLDLEDGIETVEEEEDERQI
jgi:hypothetical protein